MRILLIPAFFLALVTTLPASTANKTLIYKQYNDQNGVILEKNYVEVKSLPSGGMSYVIRKENDNSVNREEFVLDGQYTTRIWNTVNQTENSNFKGEKIGKTLYVKGIFKGEDVDLKIPLDDKPFYNNPPYNLTHFVLSDKKHIKFWMLRDDKPDKIMMQAKKRERESFLINGQEMDVIKVACTKSGLREKHFKRFYYFRSSDGLFVKEIDSTGHVADLISSR